mmetsp:Transcript_24138/g.75764  ORF Transcript_24138/g.75764 Transcript_24138/m.75764 type:complete len:266 (+) Transcript_24138:310-1107(+)
MQCTSSHDSARPSCPRAPSGPNASNTASALNKCTGPSLEPSSAFLSLRSGMKGHWNSTIRRKGATSAAFRAGPRGPSSASKASATASRVERQPSTGCLRNTYPLCSMGQRTARGRLSRSHCDRLTMDFACGQRPSMNIKVVGGGRSAETASWSSGARSSSASGPGQTRTQRCPPAQSSSCRAGSCSGSGKRSPTRTMRFCRQSLKSGTVPSDRCTSFGCTRTATRVRVWSGPSAGSAGQTQVLRGRLQRPHVGRPGLSSRGAPAV